jgi:hypothetical protein
MNMLPADAYGTNPLTKFLQTTWNFQSGFGVPGAERDELQLANTTPRKWLEQGQICDVSKCVSRLPKSKKEVGVMGIVHRKRMLDSEESMFAGAAPRGGIGSVAEREP